MKRYLSFLILFLPVYAFAHGSHGSGFMAGFTHPIFGIDHNLALVGAGFLGFVLNPKKWYLYPLSFILLMAIGGFLGIGREATTLIEKFIAFSVIFIGIAIAFRFLKNSIIAFGALALFGLAHGFAHGAEMPEDTTALQYISGYIIGAILLAIIGSILAMLGNRRTNEVQLVRFMGGLLAGAGLFLFLG